MTDSIFDYSSKAKKKSQNPPSQQTNPKAEQKNSAATPPPTTDKPYGMGVEEHAYVLPKDPKKIKVSDALALVKQARKMHQEIEIKLEELYKKMGKTPEEITRYLNNPSNFTKKQWETFQEQRKKLRDSLKFDQLKLASAGGIQGIRVEPPMDASNLPASLPEASSEKQKSKVKETERKHKMIGARKQWIPMQ